MTMNRKGYRITVSDLDFDISKNYPEADGEFTAWKPNRLRRGECCDTYPTFTGLKLNAAEKDKTAFMLKGFKGEID